MSIARQHNEWLSLVEVSGPFLSLPVLLRVFPQGLDAHDAEISKNARLAFGEWEDHRQDVAIHTAWLEFVLKRTLGYPDDYLLTGQALPDGLEARLHEHGETLRPTYALKAPTETLPRILVSVYSASQALTKPVPGTAWKTGSPDTRMMTLLHATGVPLGLVTNGEKWLLVAAKPGETTSYITWDASLWSEEPLTLRAFVSLLGVGRFFGVAQNETLPHMLAESALNQQEVTDQLGQQVLKAVEVLIQALDRIDVEQQGRFLGNIGERELYQAALTVMMRLVFLFSAEERGLLLLGDALYDRYYAISTLRDQLREVSDEQLLEHRHDAWSRFLATCRVVYGGVEHDAMRLPAYGGALFDPDRYPFLEGRKAGASWVDYPAVPIPINNRTVLHLLESLQFLRVPVPGGGIERRRLSFRALDIEQIGHVYEGLLDHTAKRASSPVLGLKASGGNDIEIALTELEEHATAGEDELVAFLRENTGRTPAAIRRALAQAGDADSLMLQSACGAAGGLYDRVKRYGLLLREDSNGYPVIVQQGSVYVTSGSDRRSTGTHYTPRSLTEPVVKATLEPLLYARVDRGGEPTRDELKTAAEILSLKICDFACGSGAFLVQACRYLSERLVEAWNRAEAERPEVPLFVPEALPAGSNHSEQLLPVDVEERLALARRLVAERCLYGVDVNPMAVEMAKLSLWLVTLYKNRPFTFLDHAIKCGDSLLGLHSGAQIEAFHLLPNRSSAQLHDYIKAQSAAVLQDAEEKRLELERFTVLDIVDAEIKARLLEESEAALESVRQIANAVIGAGLATASSDAARSLELLDAQLEERLLDLGAAFDGVDVAKSESSSCRGQYAMAERMQKRESVLKSRRPFHWLIEFPEVFLNSEKAGFDAILGNPPFHGGKKISGNLGTDYREFQVLFQADGRRGNADLCAYFFLRATKLVRANGHIGLLAVNTIAEGDTRQVGLEAMLQQGYSIYAAQTSFAWPGSASVVASAVYVRHGQWGGIYRLNGRAVPTISAFLSGEDEWSPKPLDANLGKAFQGSVVLGVGFTVDETNAAQLISRNPKSAEALFPYLNGEDVNTHPEHQPSRWVINFWDWPLARDAEGDWGTANEERKTQWLREGCVPGDYPSRVAEDFPELLAIVRQKVKPEREKLSRTPSAEGYRRNWWLFGRNAKNMYHAVGRGHAFAKHPKDWSPSLSPLPEVIVYAQTSKTKYPLFVENNKVFDQKLVVIASDSRALFAVLTSNIHYVWAHARGGTMRTDAVYNPTDVFEPYPFPATETPRLESLGSTLHERRAQVMKREQFGLTKFYNRFHNPEQNDGQLRDIRALHVEIDEAVMQAYGWEDIELAHSFHAVPYLPESDRIRFTVCEEARLEILRRLSKLNRARYDEEQTKVAASIPTKRSQGRSTRGRGRRLEQSESDVQAGLF